MGRRKKFTDEDALFWSMIDICGDDKCWEWAGYRINGRYGRFYYKGNAESSHRVAWIITHGEIPEGMFVCHHCDNPPCCNPKHLFIGTFSDNMQDMWNKNRHPNPTGRPSDTMIGERNIKARLTSEDVLQIRELHASGASIKYISTKYSSVKSSAIHKIIHRITWKHI